MNAPSWIHNEHCLGCGGDQNDHSAVDMFCSHWSTRCWRKASFLGPDNKPCFEKAAIVALTEEAREMSAIPAWADFTEYLHPRSPTAGIPEWERPWQFRRLTCSCQMKDSTGPEIRECDIAVGLVTYRPCHHWNSLCDKTLEGCRLIKCSDSRVPRAATAIIYVIVYCMLPRWPCGRGFGSTPIHENRLIPVRLRCPPTILFCMLLSVGVTVHSIWLIRDTIHYMLY